MCCFSEPIEHVSGTQIFARSCGVDQFLVYSMKYSSSKPVAMVLPLPVPKNASDDAVEFINLKGYNGFFGDLRSGFPEYRRISAGRGSRGSLDLSLPKLRVHSVGAFEASFVPTLADFDRLDERFRIPAETWDRMPEYRQYGFAVFQLKETSTGRLKQLISSNSDPVIRGVHPMAFRFPRRNPDLLYFPTVHIHDGELHDSARFDHTLYCQVDPSMQQYLKHWRPSKLPASELMKVEKTQGIIDPNLVCWRRILDGIFENKDTLVGKSGTAPEYSV